MSKWVEIIICPRPDANVVKCLFNDVIFSRFGVPCIVINDERKHFVNRQFDHLLNCHAPWCETQDRHTIPSRTSDQVKVFNKEIKTILGKTVARIRKDLGTQIV
jgi:hypothetical protein